MFGDGLGTGGGTAGTAFFIGSAVFLALGLLLGLGGFRFGDTLVLFSLRLRFGGGLLSLGLFLGEACRFFFGESMGLDRSFLGLRLLLRKARGFLGFRRSGHGGHAFRQGLLLGGSFLSFLLLLGKTSSFLRFSGGDLRSFTFGESLSLGSFLFCLLLRLRGSFLSSGLFFGEAFGFLCLCRSELSCFFFSQCLRLGLSGGEDGSQSLGDSLFFGGGLLGIRLFRGQTCRFLFSECLCLGGFLFGKLPDLDRGGSGLHGFEFEQSLRLRSGSGGFLLNARSLLGFQRGDACRFLFRDGLCLRGLSFRNVSGVLRLHGDRELRDVIDQALTEFSGGGAQRGRGLGEHARLDFERLKFLSGVGKKGEEFRIEFGGHERGRKTGGHEW